jgi:hypothetical protein
MKHCRRLSEKLATDVSVPQLPVWWHHIPCNNCLPVGVRDDHKREALAQEVVKNLKSCTPVVGHWHPALGLGATNIHLANVSWTTHICDEHNVPPLVSFDQELHVALLVAQYPAHLSHYESNSLYDSETRQKVYRTYT